LTKTQLIYNVSYFNSGGLELCLGGLSPQQTPWRVGYPCTASSLWRSCRCWWTRYCSLRKAVDSARTCLSHSWFTL